MKKSDLGIKRIVVFSLFVLVLILCSTTSEACLTATQVQNERTLCLYIYKTNVYHYGSYGSSHHHPCGTDITSVMPTGHVRAAATMLDPNIEDTLCTQSSCTDACTANQCSGTGYQTCSDTNGDGCKELSSSTTACSDPVCKTPACSGSGTCSTTNIASGQTDTGCSGITGCTGGSCKCNGAGVCTSQPACTDACTANQCSGTGYQTCSDTNGDGCKELGTAITACTDSVCKTPTCAGAGTCSQTNIGSGQTDTGCSGTTGCTGGSCKCDGAGTCTSQPTCTNPCSPINGKQCTGNSYQTCTDTNGCAQWNTATACAANKPYCTGSGICVQCIGDIQCDDGNSCTTDACSANVCSHTPVADATACGTSGHCCSGACSSNTANSGFVSECRSGPGCVSGSWSYSIANNNQICGSTQCTVCNNGYCNKNDNTKCGSGTVCNAGSCASTCTPSCVGKQCGDNGCGGSCGNCTGNQVCNSSNQCVSSCTPNCVEKQCGSNGCGGSCGTCNTNQTCDSSSGQCNDIVPAVPSDTTPHNCTPNWICSSWSGCTANKMTRSCNDANTCGNNTGKPDTQSICASSEDTTGAGTGDTTNTGTGGSGASTGTGSNTGNTPSGSGGNTNTEANAQASQGQSSINNNTEGTGGQAALVANNTKEDLTAFLGEKTYWIVGRWTGMLAYLFLALSILGGVYRLTLIKRFGRNPVMRFHGIISYLAIALVLTHIFGLLYDKYMWAGSLTYSNSFLPSFANPDATYLSLGVLSLYLMVLGVIGCIFFKALIKGIGYKTWLWGHRLTIFAYIFVYIHAWKLGTDFSMPYHIASQTLFFFIIGKYAYDYFDRHHEMSHVEPFNTVETKKLDNYTVEPISKIQFDRNLENQMVGLNGYIMLNRPMYGLYWYYLYDDGTTHIGAYSSVPLPLGPHMMKGVLRFFKDKPYIEIREIIS